MNRRCVASVERCEYAWVPVGLDTFGVLETRVQRELSHHVAAFLHTEAFGRDRRLFQPLLEAGDGFALTLVDLFIDGVAIGGGLSIGGYQGCASGDGGGHEIPA